MQVRRHRFRIMLGLTFLLGALFLVGQYYGWLHLHEQGIPLGSNPYESIFYIISGLHALHVIGGIIFLSVVFLDAMKRLSYIETFINYVNPSKQIRLQLLRTYWHFLDVLWIALFICFLI
jgi:cytochrome c oxidase subunit 3